MYDRDKLFLLEDFCSFAIENSYEKVDKQTIEDFIDDLKGNISEPYVIAMLDNCEIERYLRKVFVDGAILKLRG